MFKKIIITLIIITTSIVSAQEIRVHANTSYAFQDKFDSYYSSTNYYNGKINDGLLWGAGIEYMASNNLGIELNYLRMDTYAPTTYYSSQALNPGIKNSNFDLGINHILIGGNKYFKTKEGIEPYLGGQLGMTITSIDREATIGIPSYSDTAVKFAWGIKSGVVIFPKKGKSKIGIKLQAQVLSAVQAIGGTFYFGTGGSGAGISAQSSFVQFNIGGGLVYKLGKN